MLTSLISSCSELRNAFRNTRVTGLRIWWNSWRNMVLCIFKMCSNRCGRCSLWSSSKLNCALRSVFKQRKKSRRVSSDSSATKGVSAAAFPYAIDYSTSSVVTWSTDEKIKICAKRKPLKSCKSTKHRCLIWNTKDSSVIRWRTSRFSLVT